MNHSWAVVAQWLKSQTCNSKVSALFQNGGALDHQSKLNHQSLPGRRNNNGCPLLWVRVHNVCVQSSLLYVCTWMGEMQHTNSEYGTSYLATRHLQLNKTRFAEF